MANVLRDPRLQSGTIQTQDFMLTGNYQAAYDHLKEMFEPKSKSGPITPMTAEEIKLEKNSPIKDMLEELPPTNLA